MSDCDGVLYNKDAILEFLLPSDDAGAQARKADGAKVLGGRVQGLKDVVEVKFQDDTDEGATGWVCPITNKRLGPATRAAYLVPCGHAFAEAALREVAELSCLQVRGTGEVARGRGVLTAGYRQCNEAYRADNIITILPQKADDKTRLRDRIAALKAQGLTHALKKASGKKKRKNGDVHDADAAPANGKAAHPPNGAAANGAAPTAATSKPRTGINNAATASLTAKVLAEEDARTKRRKKELQADGKETLRSLFSTGNGTRKDGDFMTRGFTIPNAAKR